MIIAEICAVSNYSKKYSMRKSMYDALSKKYKKFYFINCNFLIEKQKIKIDENLKKNKNIFFFHPKSYKELNKFLSSHKIFLINNLSYKFYHLMIHILLSKVNIFQIRIDNLGEMSSSFIENWKSVNLQKKIYFIYLKKIPLIIYKILLNINLIWPVDILYLARKDIKNKFEKKNIFNFFLKKNYKILKPIRPKLNLHQNKKYDEKYIIFIDQNFNHEDSIIRGHKLSKIDEKKYFLLVNEYLLKLKKLYKKKIIFCLHPSSNIKIYRKYLPHIKLVKYKTDFFLRKAFIVIFHDSSAILSAIIFKKKIIQVRNNILGKYIILRGQFLNRFFDFCKQNLNRKEDIRKLNKKKLIINLNNKVKKYHKSLNKIFFIEEKYNDINKELFFEINKFKNEKPFKRI